MTTCPHCGQSIPDRATKEKPQCSIPGCCYPRTALAAKCGRNTKRFHVCPCACHQHDKNNKSVQGEWPECGESLPRLPYKEHGEYTHRGGLYQVHELPGTINVRQWGTDHNRGAWTTIKAGFTSIPLAKTWVELKIKEEEE